MSPTLYTVLSDSTSSTSLDGETQVTDKLTLLLLTRKLNKYLPPDPSLSNSPESVKKRTDVFYLQPEQNVHTHRSVSVSLTVKKQAGV